MTSRQTHEQLSILTADSVAVDPDGPHWVPIRRRLGIAAFGVNAYRAVRDGDTVIEDHVESPGQEELYVVIKGGARFTIDEESVDAAQGDGVFVARPESRRHAVALEDDTVVLAIGGWRGRAYHSLPWEPIYLARGAMREGDWARAAETLEREAGEHRETAIIRFRLACCYARLGEEEVALEELRRAIEVDPEIRVRAEAEEAFETLRQRQDWLRNG
jgi:tetratricopeptide (TPR) repeat protein